MPILNENFWLLVCFIIFIYLIYKPTKKHLLKLLDSKIEAIKSSIQESHTLKSQAEILFKEAKAEIESLKSFKQEILFQTEEEIKSIITKSNIEIDKEFNYSRSQIIDFINIKREDTAQYLKHKLASESAKLVEQYFKTTNNENLSDLEIARKIKKHKYDKQ